MAGSHTYRKPDVGSHICRNPGVDPISAGWGGPISAGNLDAGDPISAEDLDAGGSHICIKPRWGGPHICRKPGGGGGESHTIEVVNPISAGSPMWDPISAGNLDGGESHICRKPRWVWGSHICMKPRLGGSHICRKPRGGESHICRKPRWRGIPYLHET